MQEDPKGLVFDIQKFSIHDGPGIRTLVLLKGCPLQCVWCCNPESQSTDVEIVCFNNKCIRNDGYDCDSCLVACPLSALRLSPDGEVRIDRARCDLCGRCVSSCPASALLLVGEWMTVEQVFDQVWQDQLFYLHSEGGVTLSGGEPAMQPEFSAALLRRCQGSGLHTAMETCGYAPWEVMERVLPHLDLVLYDLKHADSPRHKSLAGTPNELILENARRIAATSVDVVVRVPVIPGHNDSDENMRAIAAFAAEIGVRCANLLPYHNFGVAKYGRLDLAYKLGDLKGPDSEQLKVLKSIFESYGITAKIGG
jgi:pyruvate formate lyase activating enzyme